MTRTVRTPQARAEEALAVADRLVERLEAKGKALRNDLDRVNRLLDVAVARRDHLAASPDLPQDRTPGTATRATSSGATPEPA